MTFQQLKQTIKDMEIEATTQRECLRCGCVYSQPSPIFRKRTDDICPECFSEEYVNIPIYNIPSMESYA